MLQIPSVPAPTGGGTWGTSFARGGIPLGGGPKEPWAVLAQTPTTPVVALERWQLLEGIRVKGNARRAFAQDVNLNLKSGGRSNRPDVMVQVTVLRT